MLLDGAHEQQDIMCLCVSVCVCVCVVAEMVETHPSAGGERGEREFASQIDGGEKGKERRKETGREMEPRTVPAALH